MAKEQTYEAEYLKREGDRAVISNNFNGTPINVTIPYSVIESSGLKEGDKFRYAIGRDYEINLSTVKLVKPKPWSRKQKQEIVEFLQKCIQIEKNRNLEQSSEQ